MIRGALRNLVVSVVCLVLLASRAATALEVGVIETRSVRYEPLDARIALGDVQPGDLEGLKAMLGSPAQFELAGLARPDYLKLLEFSVVRNDDGSGHIRVSTSEPIIEGALTFLVNVEWPRGRIVRGYNLRLPSVAAGRVSETAAKEAPAPPAPAERPREAVKSSQATSSPPRPASPGRSDSTYGPVRKAETLWSIASRLRPDRSISVQRMMLAILEANPGAFENGNINALNAGALLQIPSRNEIGRGDQADVIAEVRRQHSEWTNDRGRRRAADRAAPAATPQPSQAGRVEVVTPETSPGVAGRDDAVDIQALRNELALAVEDVDAKRHENQELMLRLSDAEQHIKELNRLVDLKNDEIAVLQSELRAMAEAAVAPAPGAVAEEELQPVAATPEDEAKPVMPASEDDGKPVMPAPEDEAKLDLAETESMPAPSESKRLPFGLDALPVNPMYLVGGAGVLLILLGLVALLRRRRAAADEGDEIGTADAPLEPEDDLSEDNLLEELEAVAAELSDDAVDAPDRRTLTGATGGVAQAAVRSDPLESDADSLTAEQIAELWKDELDSQSGRDSESGRGTDDGRASLAFDIDDVSGDDPALKMLGDESSDEFDISELVELADLADERETSRAWSVGEARDDLGLLFEEEEVPFSDSAPPERNADSRDQFAAVAAPPSLASIDSMETGDPVDAESARAELTTTDIDAVSVEGDDGRADLVPGSTEGFDDTMGSPRGLLDDFPENEESGAFSLDGYGDDVQTKIDLAQVYLEMDDTERARALLETVLAEGDADQQHAAQAILSRMT